MELRKEIEKSLRRENNEVDAIEDHAMKDSVLEIASADFKERDVLDLPLTARKRTNIGVESDYPGKPVSRKKYGAVVGISDSEDESEEVGTGDSESDIQEDQIREYESEVEEDDENEDGLEESSGSLSEDGDAESDSVQQESEAEHEEGSPSMQVFSSAPTEAAEIKKGLAVKEQLRVWESLLECRIKFEPSLVAANQLYQLEKMLEFAKNEKSSGTTEIDTAHNALQELSSSWISLQKLLGGNLTDKPSRKRSSPIADELESDNESIRSSEASGAPSDEEADAIGNEVVENVNETAECNPSPAKKMKHLQPPALDDDYSNFSGFRDAEITKWNEKAKISSGKAAQKDFSAFDQSILKLIESILFDKYRLVKKTQLKRSDYVIYGKTPKSDEAQQDENEDGEEETNSQHRREQSKKDLVYDPEIFDDGDFYQKLLRDFIEGKSTDSISKHERKLMELHRHRIKMKRKIDTRATKGRKLRYAVHPKLVNYMAPVPSNTFSAEAEAQLLKSLFGQALVSSA